MADSGSLRKPEENEEEDDIICLDPSFFVDRSYEMTTFTFGSHELRLLCLRAASIIELGSGIGITGILCSRFCKKVVLTDHNDEVLEASMGKQNKVGSGDAPYCDKYKTWTDDTTEFMLQWSESDSDDSLAAEHVENDSDTITHTSPSVEGSIAQSNGPAVVGFGSSMKRKNMKSPMKKHRKDKAKHAKALENDKIATSIVMLANSIASSGPTPKDPYANLWKRIEDIPFPPQDKVDIASFLSKPDQVYLRNYLNVASDQSFASWVTSYLGAKYAGGGGYTDE
nr:unnamed protein product [Digitaria exilis]